KRLQRWLWRRVCWPDAAAPPLSGVSLPAKGDMSLHVIYLLTDISWELMHLFFILQQPHLMLFPLRFIWRRFPLWLFSSLLYADLIPGAPGGVGGFSSRSGLLRRRRSWGCARDGKGWE
ncbi:unnamed protein product, partial [Phaeothamnion confervicola]